MSVNKVAEEKRLNKERVALRDALLRLYKNKDFKAVIEQAFMEKDCARYARMSGLSTNSPEVREDALAKCQAAGHLKEYFHAVEMMGNRAEANLREIAESEAELVAEYREEA